MDLRRQQSRGLVWIEILPPRYGEVIGITCVNSVHWSAWISAISGPISPDAAE